MARNKSSKFVVDDNLNFANLNFAKAEDVETMPTNDAHEVHEKSEFSPKLTTSESAPLVSPEAISSADFNIPDTTMIPEKEDIGTTQGKKGHKLPRMNMAFSRVNYEYIRKMSSLNGISATEFVNKIIEAYMSAHPLETRNYN